MFAGTAAPPGAAAQHPETLAQVVPGSFTLTHPGGAFVAELTGRGNGCPPGSWRPELSPDGTVLTATFSQLSADVSAVRAEDSSECAIDAILRAPAGRSYAVRRFGYFGRADLDVGVVASQLGSATLSGVAAVGPGRTRVAGPFNGPYTAFREVPEDELAWSPCATAQNLSVSVALAITNSDPPGWGIVRMSAADTTDERLLLELTSRACSAPPVTPPVAPPVAPPVTPPVAPPVTSLKPTQVTLLPATINPQQPFTVAWSPILSRPDAAYAVEVAAAGAAPGQVVWQSELTAVNSLVYNGPPLSAAGLGIYTVVVSAYLDGAVHRSDPATLRVLPAPVSQPSAPPGPAPSTGPTPGTSPPAPSDASRPSGALPAAAVPLLGSYALRTETFGTSAIGSMISDRQLALAEFVQVGDQVELRTRLCAKESSSLSSTVTLRHPEAYPEIRQRVSLENGRWRTLGAPVASGFERVGYVGCNGREGQRVPKRPEQTWIRGATCRCAAEPSDAPTADDCRVTDPDRDGHPGLAYPWSGLGLAETQGWVSHAASTNRAYYVDGKIDPNGAHTALVRADEVTFQLECEPGECGVSVEARPCTSEHNRALFRRLPSAPNGAAQWTCAALRQRRDVLPTGTVRAPTRCAREGVNGDP